MDTKGTFQRNLDDTVGQQHEMGVQNMTHIKKFQTITTHTATTNQSINKKIKIKPRVDPALTLFFALEALTFSVYILHPRNPCLLYFTAQRKKVRDKKDLKKVRHPTMYQYGCQHGQTRHANGVNRLPLRLHPLQL